MNVRSDLLSSCALISIILTALACAREPRFKSPRVGEQVSIAPIAVNMMLASTTPPKFALKLSVMWGGRAIDASKGDPTLHFYGSDGKLKFSKKWAEFSDSHRATGCSNEQIESMDGYLMGAALICDGSLNLNAVARIDAVDERGETRSATSWSVYKVSDDVAGVSLGFY